MFFFKKKKTSFKIFREFIFNFVCSYPLIFDLVIYKAIAIIICMLCLCIYIWGFAYYLVIVLLNSLIKTLYVFLL